MQVWLPSVLFLLGRLTDAGRHHVNLRVPAPVTEFNASHSGVKVETARTKTVSKCKVGATDATYPPKPVAKHAILRVCNTYLPELTMKVEVGRPIRMRSDVATPYGSCVELRGKTWRHDVVVVHLEGQIEGAPHVDGDGPGKIHDGYGQQRRTVEVYLKQDACAEDTTILLAVTTQALDASGLEMWVGFFEYLVRPQIATVDAAPSDGHQQQVVIHPEQSEYVTQPIGLEYGDIKAIAPGIFGVELDSYDTGQTLSAECHKCYSIIRLAGGKLIVHPPASGNNDFNCRPKAEDAPPPRKSAAMGISALLAIFSVALAALV